MKGHTMKGFTLSSIFLLFASVASAQTATYTARIEGTVTCRFIAVSVTTQQQNGGTTTNLSYVVRECPSGSAQPTTVIVQNFLAISPSAYRVQGQGNSQTHSLNVQTPQGAISLTWRPTTESQNTFSGTWNERHGSSVTRTIEDQFHSTALVEGAVLSYLIVAGERPGWVSAITQVVR